MLSVETDETQQHSGLSVQIDKSILIVGSAVNREKSVVATTDIHNRLLHGDTSAAEVLEHAFQSFTFLKGLVVVANGTPNHLTVVAGGDLNTTLAPHEASTERINGTKHVKPGTVQSLGVHTLKLREVSGPQLSIEVGHFASLSLRRTDSRRVRLDASPQDFGTVLRVMYTSS